MVDRPPPRRRRWVPLRAIVGQSKSGRLRVYRGLDLGPRSPRFYCGSVPVGSDSSSRGAVASLDEAAAMAAAPAAGVVATERQTKKEKKKIKRRRGGTRQSDTARRTRPRDRRRWHPDATRRRHTGARRRTALRRAGTASQRPTAVSGRAGTAAVSRFGRAVTVCWTLPRAGGVVSARGGESAPHDSKQRGRRGTGDGGVIEVPPADGKGGARSPGHQCSVG